MFNLKKLIEKGQEVLNSLSEKLEINYEEVAKEIHDWAMSDYWLEVASELGDYTEEDQAKLIMEVKKLLRNEQ